MTTKTLEKMRQRTKSNRICVARLSQYPDPIIVRLSRWIEEFTGKKPEQVQIVRVYTIHKDLSSEQLEQIAKGSLVDPIIEIAAVGEYLEEGYDWDVEVGFKQGVTDNVGRTAQITVEDFLQERFEDGEMVSSSTHYLIKGTYTHQEIRQVATEMLANILIEDITINYCKPKKTENIEVNVDDLTLMRISKERCLALNLNEMQAIRDHYAKSEVAAKRKLQGLTELPTDVEIEALAQTWSEHCKHKIFNAKIRYSGENGTDEIDSLFKSCIKKATDEISTEIDWLVSVFTDNAGIIKLNDQWNLAFKVETHNSPSALDPYGGALTGILGVNRDILGAGLGARLIANTDVFCFGPPNYNDWLPPRLLHPRRVFEGVRQGVEHGGNKSGVPTVNGAIVFDDRYLGKPLVYCGSVGIMPAKVGTRFSHVKEITPGDLIVIAGGRTGKDGIHGATFSSEELNADSPVTAVQIGDPFTQKKLHDCLIEARDAELFRTVTDNGAGGFSSSVGELAELSGGCEIHLDRARMKYAGLKPWEILVSESQERMTLAVPQEKMEALQELAELHEVELSVLGTFTDSGYFHALYEEETVAYLLMDFLHNGVPQLELDAVWSPTSSKPFSVPKGSNDLDDLHRLLGRYNICSKESVIRQYDHEVQGGSVVKPLTGVNNDGPSDAAVIRPMECMLDPKYEQQGVVISNGICPAYSDLDTYHMTACAIDEAIRNLVCVGGDPEKVAILDNFCWPDPVYHPDKTPDGKHKLAQLVRSNRALYRYAKAFRTPIISGKDSMKNDYKIDDTKISVPPTLLISAIGVISDVEKSVTMDVKCVGDMVYLIGMSSLEFGGSEYAIMKGLSGGEVPKVEAGLAFRQYIAVHKAMQQELVASCHDCSEGGLAVALAECAFSGGLGIVADLRKVLAATPMSDTELLFSESPSRLLITVDPSDAEDFEQMLEGVKYTRIGEVIEELVLEIEGTSGDVVIWEKIEALKSSWQKPLKQGGR